MEQLEDRAAPAAFTASNVPELIPDIQAANQTAESDTITLAPGNTFTLTAVNNTTHGPTGLPVIAATEDLTIVGSGDTIERSTAVGTPAFRLFDVAAGASLTLANLTLQGGLALGVQFQSAPSQGGAVYSQGALALDSVIVQNNTARGADGFQSWGGPVLPGIGAGGGIFATGALTMSNSTIRNNTAIGGHGMNSGWAAFDTSLSLFPSGPGGDGMGGGLFVGGGTVTISNSGLTGNSAIGGVGGLGLSNYHLLPSDGGNGFGGGLYATDSAVALHQVAISQNSAKGGLGGAGDKNQANGKLGQGVGGGLYIDATAWAGLDAFTQKHVKSNHASTSDIEIHGSYDLIP